jgi:hypothetical protein
MQKIKFAAIVFCLPVFLITKVPAQQKIKFTDFDPLAGYWKGSLTYLDYSSGKPYSMPANLLVSAHKEKQQLVFYNIYPGEPKANSTDTVTVLQDGKMLNNETVASVTRFKNGVIKIITNYKAVDGNDNKPALIRLTYAFTKQTFTIVKDVLFDGTANWIKRHQYSYKKKGALPITDIKTPSPGPNKTAQ